MKLLHVSCAFISITGFTLRGYWALTGNSLRQHRLARVLPHVVDTLLLASALGMLWLWRVSPLAVGWLEAKLIALVIYILLGMITLRFATTGLGRSLAYVAALCTAGYIVSVALTHSPRGFLLVFPF
ncbi:SirB2 family protein [Haliea sp. E17]|uniref:SirB2 family protein n=1 Tax=Haliea sp. E17 TaxID=3401576 RepID=UPI003AAB6733